MDNDTVSTIAILIENLRIMKDYDHRNELAFLGFDPDILFENEGIKNIVRDALDYNIRIVFLPNN